MSNSVEQNVGQVDSLTEQKVEEPSRYKVLMHNDDYTDMNFVVDVLCRVFNKDFETANNLMLQVHTKGIGECGIYTREIAEAKISRVHHDAKVSGYPLRCTMEKAE